MTNQYVMRVFQQNGLMFFAVFMSESNLDTYWLNKRVERSLFMLVVRNNQFSHIDNAKLRDYNSSLLTITHHDALSVLLTNNTTGHCFFYMLSMSQICQHVPTLSKLSPAASFLSCSPSILLFASGLILLCTYDVANRVKSATAKNVPINNDALLSIQAC